MEQKILIEDQIVMRGINEIKPYIRNPRKNDKTVELLCKIIPIVGFNVPIVIDANGVIIKGHARYTAAIRLGLDKIPCIVSHADTEAIKADRIADNKISEFSEWVTDDLLHEIDVINLPEFDFEELGIPTIKFDDIPVFEPEDDDEKQGGEITEEQRQKLYEEFLAKHAEQPQMTTEKELTQAKQKQAQTPNQQPRFYRCVCENCGHVMFVKEGDLCDR